MLSRFKTLLLRLPIRARLLLLVLALAVPFIAYFGMASLRDAAVERDRAGNRMLAAARITAARLDDQVGDISQVLRVLTSVVDIEANASAHNDLLLQRLAGKIPASIVNVGVWTVAGNNIGALDARLRANGKKVAQRKFFQAALQGAELAVEGPVLSLTNGALVGVFAVPVVRGGQVVAVVAASTELTALQASFAPGSMLPGGTVVVVTDAAGVVLARSADADYWVGRNERTVGGPGLGLAPNLQDGLHDGISADGVARVAGYATAARVPWRVYAGQPLAEVLADVHARLAKNLAVAAALLLLGLALAAAIGDSIASPLQQLAQSAERLGGGDLSQRNQLRQRGEIGTLASTLDQMAQTLQDNMLSLQASQAQLRMVTDNLPVLIAYWDTALCFRFANRVCEDWLGVQQQQLLGLSLQDVLGAEADAAIRPHVLQALAGERVAFERDLLMLDGMRRMQVTAIPHWQDASKTGAVAGLFVLMADVTAARESEARRLRSETRLSVALEGSGMALFDWDLASDLVFHSAQVAAMRGAPADATTSSPEEWHQLIHPDDQQRVAVSIAETIDGDIPRHDAEFRLRTHGGGWVWIHATGRVIEHDADGRARRLAGTYANISEHKANEERLRRLAEYDTLTGLPNRALFHDRLAQALKRNARNGSALALLFLDVDHFKAVNDTLGHAAGDDVLRTLARSLQAAVRPTDTVARLAGDEFTVILEDVGNAANAQRLAQKLVDGARRRVSNGGDAFVMVGASVGIAMAERADTDARALLQRADAALYEAKRKGRGQAALAGAAAVVAEDGSAGNVQSGPADAGDSAVDATREVAVTV